MKRREFIKSSLAFTAVAGASVGSAFGEILIPSEDNVSQSEMERFVRQMDYSMDRIANSGGEHLNSLFPSTTAEDQQTFFKSGLRSLLLVGNFAELPLKGQVHPWMQKRMMYSAPEVNYSVDQSIELMRNLSDESMENIQSALTDDPDLGSRIIDSLDLEAKSIGVTRTRRRQMKIMGRRLIRRMRHSPHMLVEEYVKKYEKLWFSENSDEALDKLFKMQMDEARYSTISKEAERDALAWNNSGVPDMPIGYGLMINEEPPVDEENKRPPLKGLKLLTIGVIVATTGAILALAAGGITTGLGSVGVILGVTIGPILILIALLIVIISALSRPRKTENASQ